MLSTPFLFLLYKKVDTTKNLHFNGVYFYFTDAPFSGWLLVFFSSRYFVMRPFLAHRFSSGAKLPGELDGGLSGY